MANNVGSFSAIQLGDNVYTVSIPSDIYAPINVVTCGDINSETAFFDSIRETTGVPTVGPFVKAGRQTRWTSDKLPGMENLFNPFIAFGGGDAQGFMMVSYANQRAVVGGGTGNGFSWTRELATCDWVKENTKVVGTTLVLF